VLERVSGGVVAIAQPTQPTLELAEINTLFLLFLNERGALKLF
jgi:hypothetical protein